MQVYLQHNIPSKAYNYSASIDTFISIDFDYVEILDVEIYELKFEVNSIWLHSHIFDLYQWILYSIPYKYFEISVQKCQVFHLTNKRITQLRI